MFPEQREAKRQALLDAVESLRDVFLAGADEAEAMGTLTQTTVDAIYESGLFSFKTAQVLGGAEADAMIQLDVIEAASRIEPSAGWCLMIGAGTLSGMAAFLSDEAIDEIFVGGKAPLAAGVAAPSGEATPLEGGHRARGPPRPAAPLIRVAPRSPAIAPVASFEPPSLTISSRTSPD